MALLGVLSSVLGLGSSIASAFGQSSSASAEYEASVRAADANVGLSMAAAREKALGYEISQYQSNFAATLASIQGDLKATQTEVNADIEATNVKLSAAMQATMYRLQGKLDEMEADFAADNLYRSAQSRKALGQEEMFELMRQLEYVQSDFQAQAAASGFQATDNSSIGMSAQQEKIEAEGVYQARLAYAAREQESRDIGLQGAIKEAEGDISVVMNEFSASEAVANANYTANSLKRVARIEARYFRANAELESTARKIEADGYKALAKAAIAYGKAGEAAEIATANAAKMAAGARYKSSQGSALSTLLGGAASFAGSMPQSGLSLGYKSGSGFSFKASSNSGYG